MRRRILGFVFALTGLLTGSAASAIEFSESTYEVYYGDFNSDGNAGDIYYHRKDTFVLIHGDIAVPLLVASEGSFVVYAGSSTPVALKMAVSQLRDYTKAVIGIDYHFADVNNDGYLDIVANSQQGGGSVYTVAGSSSSTLPQVTSSGDLPESFNYDLAENLFLPDLSEAGEFVAITQGSHSVNQGTMSYMVPFELPPTVNNLKPSLGLVYSSDNNISGVAGVGWTISGLSAITRCHLNISQDEVVSTSKYGTRLCLDGERLEVISVDYPEGGFGPEGPPDGYYSYWAADASYRTESNGVDLIKATGSDEYFTAYAKNGNIYTYGKQEASQNSRLYAQGSLTKVLRWALDSVEDRYGNRYSIHYDRNNDTGEHYISHINLTPNASIVFNYEDRTGSDVTWGYNLGHKYQYTQLLRSVTTYINVSNEAYPSGGIAVRQYDIDYETSPATQRYLVSSITECGFSNNQKQCAAPLNFEWQDGELGFGSSYPLVECSTGDPLGATQVVDLNSDGYNDLIIGTSIALGTPDGCFDKPSWLQIPSGSQADWEGMQAFRTQKGYALISAGVAGLTLRLRKLDFTNEQVTDQVLDTSATRSLLIVKDMSNDGLDDFIFKSEYFQQKREDNVGFINYYTGLLDLRKDFDEKHEPQLIDINENPFPELFFSIPDFDNTESPQNRIHFYHYSSQAPGVFNKDIVSGGTVEDNSIVVSDTGTEAYLCSAPRIAGEYRAFGDLNGDGNMDIIYHRNSEWFVRILKEDGALGEEINTGMSSYGAQTRYIAPYDFNKDGLTDIIDICQGAVLISGHNGDLDAEGASGFEVKTHPGGAPSVGCAPAYTGATVSSYTSDLNNDGLKDILQNSSARLAKQEQPDMLEKVVDGFGKQLKFTYSPLTGDLNNGKPFYTPVGTVNFPYAHVDRARQTVKSISISDGQGGFNHQYFNYHGGRTDLQGRGFQGFKKIEVTDTASETVTTAQFHQVFPYTGREDKVIVQDLAGNKISETGKIYASRPSALGSWLLYPAVAYQKSYGITEESYGDTISASVTTVLIDGYFNITNETTKVGDVASSPFSVNNIASEVKRTYKYDKYRDEENWLVSFLDKSTVTSTVNDENRTVVTEYEPEPSTLDVKTQYNLVDEPITSAVTTNRNSAGVITSVVTNADDIDSGTVSTRTTTFSSFEDGIFPRSVANAKNHFSTLAYNKRFGKVLTTTDPNGLVSSTTYDSLGRSILTEHANGNITRLISFYCNTAPPLIDCPSQAVYGTATVVSNQTAEGEYGAPLSITYFDMLQRKVRSEVFNFNQDIVKVDTRYDSRGQVTDVSEPFTGLQADYWTTYSNFDLLGRARQVQFPDGSSVAYTYDEKDGDKLVTTETASVVTPQGTVEQKKVTYKNRLGQVVRVEDDMQTPVEYGYDASGNLTSTIVNGNLDTEINIAYDAANNKVFMSDPDVGDIRFEYNGLGELRRQTWQPNSSDAKSITYGYDVLGRKTSRLDQKGSNSTSYTWVWDTVKKGRLTSQAGNGITESYQYDGLARVDRQTTSISGLAARHFNYTYDDFSRLDTMTYPNGLRIKNRYHAAGFHVQTADDNTDKVLWARGEGSDWRGNLTQQIFGNGVVTVKTFQPDNGRLESIVSGNIQNTSPISVNGNIQNLSYEFDTRGNLYSRQSQRQNASGSYLEDLQETFEYDSLNRLKTSTLSRGGIPEPTQYYNYNVLGNLESRTDTGVLVYDQTYNAGVHAVTHAGGNSYRYDVYGNMTERTTSSGTEYLTYDAFNKPTQIGSTHFHYGPNHARFKQVRNSVTTYYFGGGVYEEEGKKKKRGLP